MPCALDDESCHIMYLINSELLKTPKLIINNLEFGKLNGSFHLGVIKWCNNKC
jgi:hypothetical protein